MLFNFIKTKSLPKTKLKKVLTISQKILSQKRHINHWLCKTSSTPRLLFPKQIIIMHWDAKKIFQTLQFYNSFAERPKTKKLSKVGLLKELPFYDELSTVKNKTGFSGYARSYKSC